MSLKAEEVFVPHVGWFLHEPGDDVAQFLDEGWFEYAEQAFVWLYARQGDVFIDCGAHFGLYSVLYATAAREASLFAIEPNPSTLGFLKRNLGLHKNRSARILHCAISNTEGTVEFYAAGAGKAAYSGLTSPDPAVPGTSVSATILDRVCREHGITLANFVKLDVEGSEIAAIRGASESIAEGKLPVLMVEFTEQNLQRSGLSTKDLYNDLKSCGYTVCKFSGQTLELEPVEYTGPVWYDNYFAVTRLDEVNARLREASSQKRRIAREIVRRGQGADRMRSSEAFTRAEEADRRAGRALKLLEDAYASTGESNWRADEANHRADEALKLLHEAYSCTGQANARADEASGRAADCLKRMEESSARAAQADRRADEALRLLNEASARIEDANGRVSETLKLLEEESRQSDESNRRADEALKSLNEANARGGEANWRADEANRRADEALKSLNEAYARGGEANWRADEANPAPTRR